ncbi:MAG: Lrp/AsnC family transcriptional regulator [Propionibacteriaceae bacterium]|nr:Lrp/AsnC family transcriptional regulator [Propionibacteriaceae bacterium]
MNRTNSRLDRIDHHILAVLSRDGRTSFTDLGRECGLSVSAAQQRVRRLEQRGVITGYAAHINAAALNRTLTALISIRVLRADQDELIRGFIEDCPEIVTCYSVAGEANYVVTALVGTTIELEALINQFRHTAEVITTTTVVLNTVIADRPLLNSPLDFLEDSDSAATD